MTKPKHLTNSMSDFEKSTVDKAYAMLASEDDGRLCRDIPESACNDQPRNFLTHVASLAMTKTGDGLVDPKLILSWLLHALGAPAAFVGMLVPVREAGALLPQLFTAEWIRLRPQRKWVWAAGSLIQGLCVAGMAGVALIMEGASAGLAIVLLLGVFAVARSLCSVSYKDVLGKTVSKATRGTATGAAGTIAAAMVLLFGVLLSTGIVTPSIPVITVALMLAAGLWLCAAGLFSMLAETPGATEGGQSAANGLLSRLSVLRHDRQLVRFIIVRGLLIATALAPPYMLLAADINDGGTLANLGPLVLASSLAGLTSSYVWGRLADRSSRWVLLWSAVIAALALGVTALIGWLAADWLRLPVVLPALLFVLMIAYQGVRLGRSTHLVDMADSDSRANYTAVSNTVIGVLLLFGGVFGWLAQALGVEVVLGCFSILCGVAFLAGLGLEEVQGR